MKLKIVEIEDSDVVEILNRFTPEQQKVITTFNSLIKYKVQKVKKR